VYNLDKPYFSYFVRDAESQIQRDQIARFKSLDIFKSFKFAKFSRMFNFLAKLQHKFLLQTVTHSCCYYFACANVLDDRRVPRPQVVLVLCIS